MKEFGEVRCGAKKQPTREWEKVEAGEKSSAHKHSSSWLL